MKTHRDLDVYKKSIEFVTELYKITGTFPDAELYGLISQLRRASVSISSNIAEGAARGTSKDFIRFLYISLGSAAEVETQLLISRNLDYVEKSEFEQLIIELESISKMLHGLIKYLKQT